MTQADEPLPDDVETLKAMLLAERSARLVGESDARERALLIEKLNHTIARLRHERFGPSAERGALLDQLELQLFELEEDVAQAETAVQAGAGPVTVMASERCKPARRPLRHRGRRAHRCAVHHRARDQRTARYRAPTPAPGA